ncbi:MULTISPECIES: DUF167 domain-containing protein [unclassified Sphingomonas]|uniref:DUF167 domain-containing protein n=1 Tax=unclassified Sphingomonas TaxID=196159 RepID=UPI0021512C81|nr:MULTISPECIES: DUF167 domain-containing protein [unclassified Sphingomonas]MCR5869893.1 DUF167 domain-containing protein [Sphingomonas sp. J344]UUX98408.1 DUF167 domain-containing protein [Sphingomonas sp. J315]
MSQPWREAPPGLVIAVRATPRASKSVLLPGTPEHLAARIAAPPVEGAANAALIELVAKAFGVAKRDVTLIAGETARVKRLSIAGDPKTLAGIAASLYGARHER